MREVWFAVCEEFCGVMIALTYNVSDKEFELQFCETKLIAS